MTLIENPTASTERRPGPRHRDLPPVGGGRVAIESWFARAGLPVEVVGGCPVDVCDRCGPTLPAAA